MKIQNVILNTALAIALLFIESCKQVQTQTLHKEWEVQYGYYDVNRGWKNASGLCAIKQIKRNLKNSSATRANYDFRVFVNPRYTMSDSFDMEIAIGGDDGKIYSDTQHITLYRSPNPDSSAHGQWVYYNLIKCRQKIKGYNVLVSYDQKYKSAVSEHAKVLVIKKEKHIQYFFRYTLHLKKYYTPDNAIEFMRYYCSHPEVDYFYFSHPDLIYREFKIYMSNNKMFKSWITLNEPKGFNLRYTI